MSVWVTVETADLMEFHDALLKVKASQLQRHVDASITVNTHNPYIHTCVCVCVCVFYEKGEGMEDILGCYISYIRWMELHMEMKGCVLTYICV